MIRKSTGTPFKLKGAPFKEDSDPKGSTRKRENLVIMQLMRTI